MSGDEIRDWLVKADAAAGVGPVGEADALAVGEKVVVVRPAPVEVKGRVDPAAELAGIRREIAVREGAVRELILAERLERAEGRVEVLRALPGDREVAERAAAVAVWQAERGVREGGDRAGAERAYSDVVRYFPDTESAEVARRRLEELRKEG